MARNRMHPGLVALSASAIAAVYVAGYVRTQGADASIAAAAAEIATATATPVAAPTVTPIPTQPPVLPQRAQRTPSPSAPTRPVAPPPAPQTQAQTQAAYKDGTYSGQGSSRRGDVWLSVTISGAHITSVAITRSTLQYPVRDIAGLPDQVVQRQSPQVDTVSRATYSSQAFRQAVTQALAQAQA